MYYARWTEASVRGLEGYGIASLLTEIDAEGWIIRELGFNEEGREVWRSPSAANPRGYFDNQVVSLKGLESDLNAAEFERLWLSH
jgi:hypothetical protein